jgi:hypothetical protein
MDKIIKIQGTFLDVLDNLERIHIDFVELSGLYNYIFMTDNNEFNYIIHNINNEAETYTFQYYQTDKTLHNIPNAIFTPNDICDFEINITKKTFKKINQSVTIDLRNAVIEKMEIVETRKKNTKRFLSNWFC